MSASQKAPARLASSIDQVALEGPAHRARQLVRVQIGAILIVSTVGALLGMLAVGLPADDRLPALGALCVVTLLGGIFVGLTDFVHGRSVAALVRTASELRQSASERAADLARANGALRRQEERRASLLATMSHELRTPLNAMIGCSRILLDDLDGQLGPEQRADVRRIHEGGRTLLSIVDGTLDLARLDASALKVEAGPVSIRLLFDDVISMLRPLANERGLNLEASISVIGPVLADEDRLRQVLVNLVGNAIKFTDIGGVRLAAELVDGQILISVADTGIGIPPEAHEVIFEPFRQVDQSRTRRRGGTGLGLAISRRLIAIMDGRIWVESDPGAGTTFYLSLPPAVDVSGDEMIWPGSEDCAVVVVGDEPRARPLLDTLARRGVLAQCVSATDWMRRAGALHPRVVLADTDAPAAEAWRALAANKASLSAATKVVGLVHLDGNAGHLLLHPRLDVRSTADLECNLWGLVRDLAACDPLGPDSNDARMMVVGANLADRRRLSLLFEGVGLRTAEAASFAEAKLIARRLPVLGLTIDLLMPHAGVMAMLDEIAADARWRKLPVLVVTPNALTAAQQRDLARSVGAWRCGRLLPIEQLADAIESALVTHECEAVAAGRRLWPVH